MRTSATIAALILAVSLAWQPAPRAGGTSSAFATFHGNETRTGQVVAPALRKPTLRWKAEVGIQGWLNNPLVLGTMVIVPSNGKGHNQPDPLDGVTALDLASGKRLWFCHFDNDANGVAAAGDRILATSDDGHLYAIDRLTGRVAWKRPGKGKMYTYPLVVRDRVVVGDEGAFLRAFALADGRELWKVQLTGAIRGGATFDGTLVFAVSQGGQVIALTPEGKTIWRMRSDQRFQEAGESGKREEEREEEEGEGEGEEENAEGPDAMRVIQGYAPPLIAGDRLIIPFARDTYYKTPALLALDRKTGKPLWHGNAESGDFGNLRSTPVLVNDLLIYGEPYSGDAVAVDVRNGRMSYRKTIGPCFFPQYASAVAAGTTVYMPRFDGTVYALHGPTGELIWKMYLGDRRQAGPQQPAGLLKAGQDGCEWELPAGKPIFSPPAIAPDGTLIQGTAEGMVYAIGEER